MRNRFFNLSTRVPFNLFSVPRSCKEPLTKFWVTCYVFLYSAAFFFFFFFFSSFLLFTIHAFCCCNYCNLLLIVMLVNCMNLENQ